VGEVNVSPCALLAYRKTGNKTEGKENRLQAQNTGVNEK